MWLILQQDKPEDFVLATGETHSVREFVEKAFAFVNVKLRFVKNISIDPHRSDSMDQVARRGR